MQMPSAWRKPGSCTNARALVRHGTMVLTSKGIYLWWTKRGDKTRAACRRHPHMYSRVWLSSRPGGLCGVLNECCKQYFVGIG